ncbi:DUF2344 domain-containing protein [Tessaracoccus sp. MC1865]|uniref:TIGR03936 family radical SAM-associated protein n=1 Tax=Tessaracoccus sp. MC1865 TaxID=2760310 RepID=UPI001601A3D5|nr:TIGR03936 family radical SAM-associated protein [Tessaracoccus sp. MC1865]MBB1484362.1 DUF2344 domain-containing protein [Tessaracoccus sp. MC1865]QTO38527.1 TIGR03936 family radical SAM-associated protein [Tessaracoccus sp. MC1865]
MSTRQPPVQQPPPEQKLRLRYAKRGPARFTSHRDFGRALERAIRRADLPMAYSSGFNPHPRISYASPSPTSASSEAEYVELGLSEACDPAKVVGALNEVLPQGFEMLDAAVAVKESLGDLLQASDWEIRLNCDPSALSAAVAELLSREHLTVERMTKRGMRAFDVREAIISLEVVDDGVLRLRSHIGTPLVRPDDVVAALRTIDETIPSEMLLNRLSQGPLKEGDIGDPLRPHN